MTLMLVKNWSLACSYDSFCIVESLLKLLGNASHHASAHSVCFSRF
jgi:hypothetical protein